MQANLKSRASYTWLSILSAREVLTEGVFWRLGKGDTVSVFNHSWVPGLINYRL